MTDTVKLISLEYDNTLYEADLKVDSNGILDNASGFETAVTISLFTWKRDPNADVKVQGQKYGWWADTFSEDPGDEIGSHLWLRLRAKNSPETQRLVVKDCTEALAWMKTDGIAKTIAVEVERFSIDVIAAKITIVRADGGKWTGVWQIHLNKL